MIDELVICGASLPEVCVGAEPPEEWRHAINNLFDEGYERNYRLLPAVENEGQEHEVNNREDGTYREVPMPITLGQYTVRGAMICTSCFVTLCLLTPSGHGQIHELAPAIKRARAMEPSKLPRLNFDRLKGKT